MLVGDAAEIFEGAQIVLGDAVAVGIHPPELPLRHGVTALGGIFSDQRECVAGGGDACTAAGGTACCEGGGLPGGVEPRQAARPLFDGRRIGRRAVESERREPAGGPLSKNRNYGTP
jgi:hypothetical protein